MKRKITPLLKGALYGSITLFLAVYSIYLAAGAWPQLPPDLKQKQKMTDTRTKANCIITNIDATTGIVTAKVNSSGQLFQFKVSDTSLFNSLKIGQPVYANFKTRQVSLDGVKPCGVIDGGVASIVKSGVGNTAFGQNLSNAVLPEPACEITSFDRATGVGTAKVKANGQSFQFQVSDAGLFNSLKVGQGIFANFKTQQVSLDGKNIAGTIFSIGPARAFPGGAKSSNAVLPEPACVITSIDKATGVVTAKVKATGQSFQFKVSDAGLFNSLVVEQAFFANFKTNQVSFDGTHPAGNILSILPAAGTKPTGFSQGPRSPAAPTNTPGGSPPKTPAAPPGSGGQPLGAMAAGSTIARPTVAGSQNPGASTITQVTGAVLQLTGLVCSTKTDHLGAPVAQGVLIPSGATIYCRFTPPAPLPNGSPAQMVTVSTSVPSVATAPTAVTLLGTFVDFQVTTTPIPQTVPLTIAVTYLGNSTSTTVTLARAAIKGFRCLSMSDEVPCGVRVINGYGYGPMGYGPEYPFFLDLTAPADPDGLSVQATGTDGYSGQITVIGGAEGQGFAFPAKAVGVETPITYSVVDPLDGSTKTINAVLEPPEASYASFNDGVSPISTVSGIPLDGKKLGVSIQVAGDPPADGTPLKIQYGGTANLITGPATVAFPQGYSGWGYISFPVTVMPCGVPPCQVTVTVGNSAVTSATATLTVNP